MAFIVSTAVGLTATLTSYSINPATIIIASKQDFGLGSSNLIPDYPYYVNQGNKDPGDAKTVFTGQRSADFVAILMGTDKSQNVEIMDYTMFTLTEQLYDSVVSLMYIGQVGDLTRFRAFLLGTGSGVMQTKVDGVIIGDDVPIVQYRYDVDIHLTPGNHTVCVGVFNPGITTDWKCSDVFIGQKYKCTGAPYYNCIQAVDGIFTTRAECLASPTCLPVVELCDTIPKDSWKPATVNPESGMAVPFILRSSDPNKDFKITNGEGAIADIIITGKTDGSGCYTGEIPAFNDGTYTLYRCYPFFGICSDYETPITITWGKKPVQTDWIQLLSYLIIFIGIIFLANTYLKERK